MLNLLLFNLHVLIRKPHVIFSLFSYQKIKAFLKAKNRWLFSCIEYLIAEKIEEIGANSFSSGTVKAYSPSYFYKIGMLYGGFKMECKNYVNIRGKYPLLNNIFPSVQLHHRFLFGYLKMDRYFCVDTPESILLAISALNVLRKYGKKEIQPLSFTKHIAHGIYLSHFLYGKACKKALLKQVLEILSLPWMLGPTHGDFHAGNLLKNTSEMPILIDLDAFSDKSIQALDAFTFLVDTIAKEKQQKWQSVVNQLVLCEVKEEKYSPFYSFFDYDLKRVALLYILNRLGYENTIYFFLSRSIQNEFSVLKNWVK